MFTLLRAAISSLFPARREPQVDEGDRQPISEEDLWGEINDSCPRMSFEQRRLWDMVKIMPEKWAFDQKTSHGTWVVAILGRTVIRYDDADWGGFVLSLWTRHGVIDADFSSEASLEDKLQIMASYFNTTFSGPPDK
ncbi:hypothetical protein KX729_07675 [Rhizobium sp. XQZ8]|uniref:hypothetical protein n=1 Tax=Rhizobium populisoli TaxID=2859785 RepID=UPI001CA4C5CB|nr:hypothetical protein [Rhizobium populisoli]MBW6421317.1 hypothetical protein [Rhizobium populisoli]